MGKSASIHGTQARFIQGNGIEYPLYRSARRLNAVGVFHSLRARGVSPIFLKAATTAIDLVRPFYPATFPSFPHIYHKVSDNPRETTRPESAVFEVGPAFTCDSHFTSATFNIEVPDNEIIQSTEGC